MTVTAADLQEYVRAKSADGFVTACLAQADELVTGYVGDSPVPDVVRDRAVLEVGSELFHRRNSPQGVAEFATSDGAMPVRIARDPMAAVYPLLARYVTGGIA